MFDHLSFSVRQIYTFCCFYCFSFHTILCTSVLQIYFCERCWIYSQKSKPHCKIYWKFNFGEHKGKLINIAEHMQENIENRSVQFLKAILWIDICFSIFSYRHANYHRYQLYLYSYTKRVDAICVSPKQQDTH